MHHSKSRLVLAILAILALTLSASAGEKKNRNKYQGIEVVRFDVQQGVNFPPDYLNTLVEEVISQLKETGKFKQVLREGEKPETEGLPTLRLTGTITEFKPGSRAKRYLIGFGAGTTKVVAQVKFTDATSGEVLYQAKVDGKVWIGFTAVSPLEQPAA